MTYSGKRKLLQSSRVAATALLLAILGWRASAQTNRPAPASYQVTVVSLFPHGFEPQEISRPRGPFLLVIRNYDHGADHAFDAASADQAILPAAVSKDQFRWFGLVDLTLGDHFLQDHGHAERRLKITIRP